MKNAALIISLWVLSLIVWGVVFNDYPVRKWPKSFILHVSNPSYGTCAKCGAPWKYVYAYNLLYNDFAGLFFICEDCWDESTLSEKKDLYHREWEKHGWVKEVSWERLDSLI